MFHSNPLVYLLVYKCIKNVVTINTIIYKLEGVINVIFKLLLTVVK